MSDDDMLTGVVAGVNLTRQTSFAGPVVGVDSVVVRLSDGREVAAILKLPRLEHSWMVRTISIGCRVRIHLGTVLDPIRIVEINDPAPESGG